MAGEAAPGSEGVVAVAASRGGATLGVEEAAEDSTKVAAGGTVAGVDLLHTKDLRIDHLKI